MNTDQIIKALECCNVIGGCKTCPYAINGRADKDGECGGRMTKDATTLIKDKLAEIRGLRTAIATIRGVIESYEYHNENLKKENAYLRGRLAEEMKIAKDMKGT